MSFVNLFGCPINVVSEEAGWGCFGSSITVEDCPNWDYLDSNSNSGSVSMDAEPQFIDFFDPESYDFDTGRGICVSSNQRVSTSGGFNIWEEDIELGLGIGLGSGSGSRSGSYESCGVVVPREIDSGRVEDDTVITPDFFEAMVLDVEFQENLRNAFDYVPDPVQVSPLRDVDWPFLVYDSSILETDFLASVFEDNEIDEEYDPFPQIPDDMDGVMGSPPASKRVVDDLPTVVITSEHLSNGNSIVCAICKDDIVVEEKAKRLPCKHCYHGECILPWLGIRNTCPVCRYELPTDDLEYEAKKSSQRLGGGIRVDEVVHW